MGIEKKMALPERYMIDNSAIEYPNLILLPQLFCDLNYLHSDKQIPALLGI